MKYVLFSFDGRINRAQYWQTGILPLSALALLWGLMSGPVFYLFPSVGMLVSIGAILCLVWGFTAASIKRCHDTGHSGFWTLLYLIPGVALDVWPESHWQGFALRQADEFQSYAV